MKKLSLLAFILLFKVGLSQLNEEFSDGNYTFQPNWIGTDTKFIINTSYQLQLKSKDTLASSAHLVTAHQLSSIEDIEWRVWVKQSFSPSNNNYSRIYLTADNEKIDNITSGYYLQLGEAGSGDAIRLFKNEKGTSKELLNGTIGTIATNFIVQIKVTRSKTGVWSLYTDYNGGINFQLEASNQDPSNLLGTYMGVFCNYTKTNASKFYFDNFYAGPPITDKKAPEISNIEVKDNFHIEIEFNESIDTNSLKQFENLNLSDKSITIIEFKRDSLNKNKFSFLLNQGLINGKNYQLTLQNISDLAGNKIVTTTRTFTYLIGEEALYGDVIINEIMSSPSPSVGLPEIEYIELYNKSDKYFQLEGWKIGDATGEGKILSVWLKPKEYKVICNTAGTLFLNQSIGVTNFPLLNNTGDKLRLINNSNQLIDSVSYTSEWYSTHESDGYSLERINPNHPCSDSSNWAAAISEEGGTPGFKNSRYSETSLRRPLQIHSTEILQDNRLKIVFNQGILANTPIETWKIEPTVQIIASQNSHQEVILTFDKAITPSSLYLIKNNHVNNCWNESTSIEGKFGRTEPPSKGDIRVNEILAQPYEENPEFLELINASNKWIDLKGIEITVGNYTKKIQTSYLLIPNEVVYLSKSPNSYTNHYQAIDLTKSIQMELPSLPNEGGTISVTFNGIELDHLDYQSDWHLPLLNSLEGKSLERISTEAPSNQKENWHTAAQNYQFATPGMPNSHLHSQNTPSQEQFELTHPVISPNNDGIEDLLAIQFSKIPVNCLLNMRILDLHGRTIYQVTNNELLSEEGTLFWDGITDKSQKCPIGAYIVYIELVDHQTNRTSYFKLPFAVGG